MLVLFIFFLNVYQVHVFWRFVDFDPFLLWNHPFRSFNPFSIPILLLLKSTENDIVLDMALFQFFMQIVVFRYFERSQIVLRRFSGVRPCLMLILILSLLCHDALIHCRSATAMFLSIYFAIQFYLELIDTYWRIALKSMQNIWNFFWRASWAFSTLFLEPSRNYINWPTLCAKTPVLRTLLFSFSE